MKTLEGFISFLAVQWHWVIALLMFIAACIAIGALIDKFTKHRVAVIVAKSTAARQDQAEGLPAEDRG